MPKQGYIAESMEEASPILDQFFRTWQTAVQSKLFSDFIIFDSDINLWQLTLQHTMHEYQKNLRAQHDKYSLTMHLLRRVKTESTTDFFDEELLELCMTHSPCVGDACADAFSLGCAAHRDDVFALSLGTDDVWNTHEIVLTWKCPLCYDVVSVDLPDIVQNLATPEHVSMLTAVIDETAPVARELWDNKDALFPNLKLLDNSVGAVLQTWAYPADVLEKTKNALSILEDFTVKWKESLFLDYQHEHLSTLGLQSRASGESATVKQHPKKRRKRLFRLPDIGEVFCENHIKLPRGYRLYFFPYSQNKKCIYVVYIGPHL